MGTEIKFHEPVVPVAVQQTIQEIVATCNVIGFTDLDGTYYKDEECESCLKDLLRFLRRDTETFVYLRQLGMANIVESDLIPLLKQHCEKDHTLFDIVLRLLVNLTNPAFILFKEKKPKDVDESRIYLDINRYLNKYKKAFAHDIKAWAMLAKKLGILLKMDFDARQEEQRIMLERILILVRNILNVPIDTFELHAGEEDVNDYLIEMLCESGMMELIHYMCSNEDEFEFAFHLLEIISSMLREQNGEFLAKSSTRPSNAKTSRRNIYEQKVDHDELKELIEKERQQSSRNLSSPYNRFHATYVVKNMKSLGERELIIHKAVKDVNSFTFDTNKQKKKRTYHTRQIQDDASALIVNRASAHRSSHKTRSILREFCSQFISQAYNKFIRYVRSALERRHAQENDETYYLWCCQFFMEFNRCSGADSKFIMETFNGETFHYLHTLIENYLDMFVQEKKNFKPWSRRLHYALKAYRELLFTIAYVGQSTDVEMKQITADMKQRVFYEFEYRELLLSLISGFKETKMTIDYLKDLVETNHIFLRMMESFAKKSGGKFTVQTKKRVVRRKKKKNNAVETKSKKGKKTNDNDEKSENGIQLENEQENACKEMDSRTDGTLFDDVFRSVSDFPVTSTEAFLDPLSQPVMSTAKSLDPLSETGSRKPGETEDDGFEEGEEVAPSQEVTLELQAESTSKKSDIKQPDIEAIPSSSEHHGDFNTASSQMHANLDDSFSTQLTQDGVLPDFDRTRKSLESESKLNGNSEKPDGVKTGEAIDETSEEDEEEPVRFVEKPLELLAFFTKYANAKVLKAYTTLLQDFKNNKEELNHSIVKLFYRIAFDCKMPIFLFQLSLFRIFQSAFALSKKTTTPSIEEIKSLGLYIVRKFVEHSQSNKKLLFEILFWKNKKDVQMIEDGYKVIHVPKKRGKTTEKIDEEIDKEISDSELEDLKNFNEHLSNKKRDDDIFGPQKTDSSLPEFSSDEEGGFDIDLNQILNRLEDDSDINDADSDDEGEKKLDENDVLKFINQDDDEDENRLVINEDPLQWNADLPTSGVAGETLGTLADDDNTGLTTNKSIKRKKAAVFEDSDDESGLENRPSPGVLNSPAILSPKKVTTQDEDFNEFRSLLPSGDDSSDDELPKKKPPKVVESLQDTNDDAELSKHKSDKRKMTAVIEDSDDESRSMNQPSQSVEDSQSILPSSQKFSTQNGDFNEFRSLLPSDDEFSDDELPPKKSPEVAELSQDTSSRDSLQEVQKKRKHIAMFDDDEDEKESRDTRVENHVHSDPLSTIVEENPNDGEMTPKVKRKRIAVIDDDDE